ncbi:hypothetical protein DSCA_30210 [Desulfosarcina alkanivorans]|uniref:HTH merR-type domain-containing protein n=1 Tax=Desulfosarcina alkanivorans TaxID=571177 RepID=A0A5K7YQ55_9BACT|nr:hypothetical protein [Desulfosarcina alkanivorans]BBO69091.1 hypothetical protein DSCA_30210 [Desulfosarcina alkanivorans]
MQTPVKFIATGPFAKSLGVKPATARRSYCVNGQYLGIVPKKLPNGRLLWSTEALAKVLNQAK